MEKLYTASKSKTWSWLIGKDSDEGKDWRQEEKGVREDEMVGWHHWLNGHEFEQIPGDGEGQGSLACFSPWGHKESDVTEWLNNNNSIKGRKRISIRTMPCYARVDAVIQNLMFETEKKFSPVCLEWESLNHGRVNLLNTYEWIFWRNYSLNLPGALKL